VAWLPLADLAECAGLLRGIIAIVIRRLYVNNFRCLENFELRLAGQSSVLLIGKNGSGKTAVGLALEVLQRIGRGTSEVDDLVKPKDLYLGRTDAPVRFEIEVELQEKKTFEYVIAFELPRGSKQLRVFEEKLSVGGETVYTRIREQMQLARMTGEQEGPAKFAIERRLVALHVFQEQSATDPLFIFKEWLARMLILRPIPSLIAGQRDRETLEPNVQVTDFGAWFSGLLASAPSAYGKIAEYLKQVMPDLIDIKNPLFGKDPRNLVVQFAKGEGTVSIAFADLSDGEKCFMICAMVLAANDAYGPLVCFWDEPDNYLALDEVGHFVLALRKEFQLGGQFIATSHNPEAIRRFSYEDTLYLSRRNHLEPTIIRPVSELQVSGDLVGALIRGDVEP
jgi:predicted ATPase